MLFNIPTCVISLIIIRLLGNAVKLKIAVMGEPLGPPRTCMDYTHRQHMFEDIGHDLL